MCTSKILIWCRWSERVSVNVSSIDLRGKQENLMRKREWRKNTEKTPTVHAQFICLYKPYICIYNDTSLTAVNFHDISLDLQRNIYKPYRRPNDILRFINIGSWQPLIVFKSLVKNISRRISIMLSHYITMPIKLVNLKRK